jgi:flagellar basal-body rod modification protein FlgD
MSPTVQSSTGAGAASSATAGSSTAVATGAVQVTEGMFMQLLVAQLQNQDPMSPEDGTQFVTQLAQLQQLEQSVATGQDVAAIRADLTGTAALSAASQTATT